MEPTKEGKLVFLGVFIVVAAGIGIVLLNPFTAENGSKIQHYKSFAEKTHQELENNLNEAKQALNEMDSSGLKGNQKERMELLKKVYESFIQDLEWIKGKETVTLEKIRASGSETELDELAKKEAAYFVLLKYATEGNANALLAREESYEIAQEMIESAEEKKETVLASGLGESKNFRVAVEEAGLKKEAVEEKAAALMEEFIEYRKKKFENSEGTEKFVQALQLLHLNGLLKV